jgi:hypothetical protein
MLDISNAVHEHSVFSALTVFALAGNPNKPIVHPTGRSGIGHEQCHLWQPGFQYYLWPFGYQLKEVTGKIQ